MKNKGKKAEIDGKYRDKRRKETKYRG